MNGEQVLKHLAQVAERVYGLTVWQWKPGHVGTHAPDSYHSRKFPDGIGQAFDAYGPASKMRGFARYVATHYGDQISEGIHNSGWAPRWNLSRKHGRHVPYAFWGAVWGEHRNHVHIARGPDV